MFRTYNGRPNFECRNLAGSKHGGWKLLVFFREWWQWQVQKTVSRLTNCCKILSRRNKTQICCSVWSCSLCWRWTDYGCTKNWVLLQIRQNYKFPSEKTVWQIHQFFLKEITQNCSIILLFLVCWSLYGWWSSWPFFGVCEGSWIDFTYCWLWESTAPMSANHSNQNLLKSFKKEVPHAFWMLVNALFTKQAMLFQRVSNIWKIM